MIVSASYRTDIPAFYADWFRARLAAGHADVRNPYGGADYRVDLRAPAVDGFVFWTRNLEPFSEALDEVAARDTPFTVQMTITGYPRALEASVVDGARAVDQVRRLAERFGPRAAVWRYDPILATTATPPDWHRETFARLAGALSGAVDEAVVSWATIYAKTARNLDAAARRDGFAWTDPPDAEKAALLADLAGIAAGHAMALTLCAQPNLLEAVGPVGRPPHPSPLPRGERESGSASFSLSPIEGEGTNSGPSRTPSPFGGEGWGEGARTPTAFEKEEATSHPTPKAPENEGAFVPAALRPARCIDAARLSDVAGRPIAARTKGNRPGCECAESRDIGAYDTCPHGCVYCYAVRSAARARSAFKAHDPGAEAPLGRSSA